MYYKKVFKLTELERHTYKSQWKHFYGCMMQVSSEGQAEPEFFCEVTEQHLTGLIPAAWLCNMTQLCYLFINTDNNCGSVVEPIYRCAS